MSVSGSEKSASPIEVKDNGTTSLTLQQNKSRARIAIANISFFAAILRARPIFAIGYGIVIVVCLVAITIP